MGECAPSLVVERRIAARPSTVYSFFSDATRWLRWQGVEADIELEPGGVFRMNVRGDEFASGTVLEVVPERRLVFTWGWEEESLGVPPGSTVVEIELEPDGDGTFLRLTHRDLRQTRSRSTAKAGSTTRAVSWSSPRAATRGLTPHASRLDPEPGASAVTVGTIGVSHLVQAAIGAAR
jgi:uncharacterized protein YndB with AHSA1/START domain